MRRRPEVPPTSRADLVRNERQGEVRNVRNEEDVREEDDEVLVLDSMCLKNRVVPQLNHTGNPNNPIALFEP